MRINFFPLRYLLLSLIFIFPSCKSDEKGSLAVIVTSIVDVVTPISATCSGNIISESGPTERGVCWNTDPAPDVTDSKVAGGTGAGEFSYLMTGLTPQTTYYARAYAVNKAGTAYGEELIFTTPEDHSGETGTVTDIDGNVYQTMGIGAQYWTTGNLKTTRFNDGTHIPLVAESSAWEMLVAPGYCWYANDEAANKEIYGALYNWYVVISSKLPPLGWHVPTDAEWTILETFLGGLSAAGGKLKETGTVHWLNPNTGATNETGFTALPGGMRLHNGSFQALGEQGNFWTVSPASNQAAWYRSLDNMSAGNTRGNNTVRWGLSVRLVKDI